MAADEAVQRHWMAQLARFWVIYNREYLKGALAPPVFRLGEAESVHGTWTAATRDLTISRRHIERDPWIEVLGTLRHEMAHQFVSEVMAVEGEAPHGPAFKRACELLRVVPSATGGDDARARETSRIVGRVHKLFALGASPNRHEAEAAMRKAQALVAEYELRDLRSGEEREYGVRQLGPVKQRHARWEQLLAGLLGEFFCVQAIWSPSFDAKACRAGTALFVYGADRNLAMAEHVHVCLSRMLDPMWRDHRRRHPEIVGNRDRQKYQEGVLLGFRERLREQNRDEPSSRQLAMELARGGDLQLQSFYRWHNPRVRGGRGKPLAMTEAHLHGKRDGRRISLQQPVDGGRRGGLLETGG